ncbi:hypothetical protein NEOLEDRAFT_927636 [Neolentinus lepideus HHB14362 ss-1]|uniref:Uncharacterized protein n=1 Tax=Neolentinus lepideus HHB14362 ss-1 TaxID=1314782 RepID=A0A165NN84_9AGAM|nr:hypothetical protein NEOLEDRAFT_927636 [Neolentinus lepideus HHB14362 ss-1]
MTFNTSNIMRGVSLDAAGLVALADLKTITARTALMGTSSFLDVLFIAPGIHTQQRASEVNGGEYPTTGALHSGFVFRIENQATVSFLQSIAKTGHVTNVAVAPKPLKRRPFSKDAVATVLYLAGLAMTIGVLFVFWYIRDWWGLGVLGMLILARFFNVIVTKHRTRLGWKGVSEPGLPGDLFVLLSEDRWVRMRGLIDDLKLVTGGQWMHEETTFDSFLSSFGTLLVYAAAAVAGNATTLGKLLLACLLLTSAAFLGLCNTLTETMHMYGRALFVEGKPKAYTRRAHLVRELIAEHHRDDWAISMGLTVPEDKDKLRKVVH